MQLPSQQVTRAVIQRYARLLHRYATDLGTRPLVLPNASFFPDTFAGDAASAQALVARMQEHAGMDDIPLEVRVVDPAQPPASSSSCSSGSCGVPLSSANGIERLVDQGESWLLQVPAVELRHPVALTTNLARSLAFMFLVETQLDDELLEPPVDVTADLIAVALGFGPLMLQGSYIYAKSCGGPQVASVTKIGVSELSVAVALFAQLGEHKIQPALRELDVTQKALLNEAFDLLDSNPQLISKLRRDPLTVSREEFSLSPAKSLLARLFSKKAAPQKLSSLDQISPDMDLDEVESLLIDMPPSSRAGRASSRPQKPSDDLKSLVADALKEVRA